MKTYQDIKDARAELDRLSAEFEEQMFENGGEVTEETEQLERQKDAISDLLSGEGIGDHLHQGDLAVLAVPEDHDLIESMHPVITMRHPCCCIHAERN